MRAAPVHWNWRPALLPVVLVTLSLAAQVIRVPLPVLGHGWARLNPELWPVELVPDLREHAEKHPGAPIFNEYAFGGFLIYYSPELRVYVDDRCEVYGDRWLHDFVVASETDPGAYLAASQIRYGHFDLALVQVGSGFDRYFQGESDWTVVGRAQSATLYQRMKPTMASRERERPE
jgi:hypothetical protein